MNCPNPPLKNKPNKSRGLDYEGFTLGGANTFQAMPDREWEKYLGWYWRVHVVLKNFGKDSNNKQGSAPMENTLCGKWDFA